MFKLSEQQNLIVEAVSKNDADIQVIARAGCGKTTTILASCEIAKGKIAFFAFNKSIATELAQKAPKNVNVQTLHSLGFGALRNIFRNVRVEADKTFQILKPILKNEEWILISPVKKIVSLCKNNLTEPFEENLWDLCEEYSIEVNGDSQRIFELVRIVLRESIPFGQNALIDFDDMIWLPVQLGLKGLPKYDWVFVDEAQDLNAAQQELILSVGEIGRICYVGDSCQAIYHFRGADSDAMDNLKNKLNALGRKVVTLPLTFTRRCPKKIVKLANIFVPDFEALDEAPEGIVEYANEINAIPGDMILCRLNAPLVPVAYSLLKNGVPAKIQGKDIGEGLISLIKKLNPTSIENLVEKIDLYAHREINKLNTRYKDSPSKKDNAVMGLKDKVDTLICLALEQTTIDGLKAFIDRLFSSVNGPNAIVLLSTIHKAKGLEAPIVYIIETPFREGKQESNIQYVAITRAKMKLVFVKMDVKK